MFFFIFRIFFETINTLRINESSQFHWKFSHEHEKMYLKAQYLSKKDALMEKKYLLLSRFKVEDILEEEFESSRKIKFILHEPL